MNRTLVGSVHFIKSHKSKHITRTILIMEVKLCVRILWLRVCVCQWTQIYVGNAVKIEHLQQINCWKNTISECQCSFGKHWPLSIHIAKLWSQSLDNFPIKVPSHIFIISNILKSMWIEERTMKYSQNHMKQYEFNELQCPHLS